jgi:hypothetical protein
MDKPMEQPALMAVEKYGGYFGMDADGIVWASAMMADGSMDVSDDVAPMWGMCIDDVPGMRDHLTAMFGRNPTNGEWG